MGARVNPASTNLFVHAPRTRKSKNGLRGNTALYLRVPGLCTAKRSLASPCQGPRTKRIPAHQTKSRRLNKLSATSGCSERIKPSGWRALMTMCQILDEPWHRAIPHPRNMPADQAVRDKADTL